MGAGAGTAGRWRGGGRPARGGAGGGRRGGRGRGLGGREGGLPGAGGGGRDRRGGRRGGSFHVRSLHRQGQSEGGSLADAGGDLDSPVVVLDDPVGDGHPEARPLLLGGEEGIEDVGEEFGGNADAGVGDQDPDDLPGAPLGTVREAEGGAGRNEQARGDGETPPLRHGLDGIVDRVGEAPVQLLPVRHGLRQGE